jgi:hypothetical protein
MNSGEHQTLLLLHEERYSYLGVKMPEGLFGLPEPL